MVAYFALSDEHEAAFVLSDWLLSRGISPDANVSGLPAIKALMRWLTERNISARFRINKAGDIEAMPMMDMPYMVLHRDDIKTVLWGIDVPYESEEKDAKDSQEKK